MTDHKRKKKKKRGRTKLFTSCFRPFPNDETPITININNNNSDRPLGKPVLIEPSGCEGDDACVDLSSERSSFGRSVSRSLKAMASFQPMMVKKIFSSSKSSTASDVNDSFGSTKTGKQSDHDIIASGMELTDMDDSSSGRCSNMLSSSSSSRTTSSSSYSSSSSSSTNSTSRWLSEPKTDTSDTSYSQKPTLINSSTQTDSISLPLAKINSILIRSSSTLSQLDSIDSKNVVVSNPDKIKQGGNNWNIRWCLFLLLSFIVLVVYGRIYAILCTSIWFYLVPRRRVKRVNSVANSGRVIDTESEQYKKRVIMAGLLDRTRNPLR